MSEARKINIQVDIDNTGNASIQKVQINNDTAKEIIVDLNENTDVTASADQLKKLIYGEQKPIVTSEEEKPIVTSEEEKPIVTSEEEKPIVTSEQIPNEASEQMQSKFNKIKDFPIKLTNRYGKTIYGDENIGKKTIGNFIDELDASKNSNKTHVSRMKTYITNEDNINKWETEDKLNSDSMSTLINNRRTNLPLEIKNNKIMGGGINTRKILHKRRYSTSTRNNRIHKKVSNKTKSTKQRFTKRRK
jgi:hypothetical protein